MKLGIQSTAYMDFNDMAPGAQLMKSHGFDCADYQHFIDTTTARVNITNYVAHELFWSSDFHLHHRLKQHWAGLLDAFTGSKSTCERKC